MNSVQVSTMREYSWQLFKKEVPQYLNGIVCFCIYKLVLCHVCRKKLQLVSRPGFLLRLAWHNRRYLPIFLVSQKKDDFNCVSRIFPFKFKLIQIT